MKAPTLRRLTPRRLSLRKPIETTAVAAIAVGVAALIYRVWESSFRAVPLYQDRSDARLIATMVKTIHTEGWYLTNPNLGAPFGSQLYDFPHGGENLQLGLIWLISLVSDDYAFTMNLYYLLGFGLLAGVTFGVLRHLRFGPAVAGLVSLLYTFLPYHFWHGQQHLYRSTYFSAPLAALLLLWALSPRSSWTRGRVVAAAVLAVVVATTETMTVAFTMTLLAAGAIVAAVRARQVRRLVAPAALIAVLAVAFLASNAPTLVHYAQEGTNEAAARRVVTEQERFGVKLSRVVLPPSDHRFEPFAELGAKAQEETLIPSEGGQYLGVLGVAGFFGAVYGALAHGLGRRRATPDGAEDTEDADGVDRYERPGLKARSSTMVVLAVLFGTVAGLAVILSVAGFSQVRVWNRIIVLIAFFSFVVLAIWFERLDRWARGRWGAVVAAPALAVLGVGAFGFALWDGANPSPRDYDEMTAQVEDDREMVAAVEAAMPDGADILQLPAIPFPEHGPELDADDYDHLRAYLASDGSVDWSYGIIRGRPEADWQQDLIVAPLAVGDLLPAIVGMGYEGIWLDRFGLLERGDDYVTVLENRTGEAPIVSPTGRFVFFDLVGYREALPFTDAELAELATEEFGIAPPADA